MPVEKSSPLGRMTQSAKAFLAPHIHWFFCGGVKIVMPSLSAGMAGFLSSPVLHYSLPPALMAGGIAWWEIDSRRKKAQRSTRQIVGTYALTAMSVLGMTAYNVKQHADNTTEGHGGFQRHRDEKGVYNVLTSTLCSNFGPPVIRRDTFWIQRTIKKDRTAHDTLQP